jgi:hypothetical protein
MDHRSLASSLLFGLFVTLVGGNQDVHEYWEEGHDDHAGEDVLGWGFVDLSEDFGNPPRFASISGMIRRKREYQTSVYRL